MQTRSVTTAGTTAVLSTDLDGLNLEQNGVDELVSGDGITGGDAVAQDTLGRVCQNPVFGLYRAQVRDILRAQVMVTLS